MTVERDTLVEMLHLMHTIRAFETKARQLYEENRLRGNFLGALHSYEGEEAVAVGACVPLRKDDYVLSTHRGHGHCIAKGADPQRMMAELLGKETGISKGRGGSMHMFDPSLGLLGGNGIVGGGLTIALGPAFAAQYRETDHVTVCFFGDGAACQGSFHESLNLAAVWKLPVVFVCENNQYAVTMHVADSLATGEVASRADGYGCPGRSVDGMDVLAVHQATVEAVARAREGAGPSLIECITYRYEPHCMVIPDRRDSEECQMMRELDPIPRFEQYLVDHDVMTQDEQAALRARVQETIEQAAEQADAGALPDPSTAGHHLWA